MKKDIGKKFTAFALAVMIVGSSLFSETLISEAAGSRYVNFSDDAHFRKDFEMSLPEEYFNDGLGEISDSDNTFISFIGSPIWDDYQIYTAIYNDQRLRKTADGKKETALRYVDSSKFGGYTIRCMDLNGKKLKGNYTVEILGPTDAHPTKDVWNVPLYTFTQDDFNENGYLKSSIGPLTKIKDLQYLNQTSIKKSGVYGERFERYNYGEYYKYVNYYRIKISENSGTCKVSIMPYNQKAFVEYLRSKAFDTNLRMDFEIQIYYAFHNLTNTKFSIKYDLDGGKNNSSNPSTYMPKQSVKIENPTKTGYVFKGWDVTDKYGLKTGTGKPDADNFLTNYFPDSKIPKNTYGDIYLKAVWEQDNSYSTIKYSLNGGKNNKKNVTSYKTSKGFTLKNPTKKGYTFKGWYLDSKFKNKLQSNKISANSGNVKVYAKWKKASYKITYKLNKGKNNKKNPVKYTVTSKNITLKAPTRKGYTFKGWYKDKKFKKKITTIKKGSTGNKTLYAKWKKTK